MGEISFEPKFFVKIENGMWTLKNGTPTSLLPQAFVEGEQIAREGGALSEASEGYPIVEAPLNRGAVDAFKNR